MLLEPELTELQRQLAQIDLLTKPRRRAQPDFIELLLLKLRHLKIKIYQETGHQIPHVHVDYGREHHVASYSIIDGRRLAGTLDRKYDREVVSWITKYRTQLLEVWSTAQAGQNPGPLIEPRSRFRLITTFQACSDGTTLRNRTCAL
jgi:hypothetical protein